jgi:assimilatory nitrate reductase catalytic subunit
MGFADGFAYESAADVFREHAALSAFENDGSRDFDIGAVARLSDDEFNALDPVQWPLRASTARSERRFFAEGGFFTPDGRAHMAVVAPPQPPQACAEFPFRLNTGRVRDQWHTMTRTGLSPRLAHHTSEPFVEMHPDDATTYGISHDGFARLRSAYGECVLRVVLSEGQQRGSLFAPIHWSDEMASSASIGRLVTPATDPYSGQPDAKATPVSIEPVSYVFRGFVLARERLALPKESWWAKVALDGGTGWLIASNEGPAAWRAWAKTRFAGREIAEYSDAPRGLYRAAAFDNGRLVGCLFIGPAEAAPQWDAVKALFEREDLGEAQRRAVLSGKSTEGLADPGPVICACFGVGLNVIKAAIESGAAVSVEQIGAALRAGTNCGSCLPELKRIVDHERAAQTA